MRELNMMEIETVSGGRMMDAVPYFTAMITIGAGTFGPGWGGVAVGAALAASPIVLGAMVGLTLLGGVAAVAR